MLTKYNMHVAMITSQAALHASHTVHGADVTACMAESGSENVCTIIPVAIAPDPCIRAIFVLQSALSSRQLSVFEGSAQGQ